MFKKLLSTTQKDKSNAPILRCLSSMSLTQCSYADLYSLVSKMQEFIRTSNSKPMEPEMLSLILANPEARSLFSSLLPQDEVENLMFEALHAREIQELRDSLTTFVDGDLFKSITSLDPLPSKPCDMVVNPQLRLQCQQDFESTLIEHEN